MYIRLPFEQDDGYRASAARRVRRDCAIRCIARHKIGILRFSGSL
jgi:hypothetical protein